MREIFKTNDPVEISWLTALLKNEGIEVVLLDNHMSILEGSIGILPRRLMVSDEDYQRAVWTLERAGKDISRG